MIENMLLKEIFTEKLKRKEHIIQYLTVGILFILIMKENLEIKREYTYSFPKNTAYYGSITTENTSIFIEEICDFIIENKKNDIDVKILSLDANVFMVPLKLSNQEMDLPFLGNLGIHGEDGLIEKVRKLKNIKILIRTDEEKIGWQESKKVRNHIIENYEKVGEIGFFSIFYIK